MGRKTVRSLRGEPFLLILMMVIVVGIALAILWSSHRSKGLPVAKISKKQEQASLSINGIRMTAVRGAQTAWYLTARHGIYLDNNSKAILHGISVTFITDKGDRVLLTADRATYYSSSNDLEVSGHVVVKNGQYQMVTAQLAYHHKRRTLTTNTRVTVKGDGAQMAADKMTYNLQTNIITFEGDIAGALCDIKGL